MTSTRILLVTLAAAGAIVLASCSGSSSGTKLTDTDNNRSITIKQGETLEVVLPANHTTGYSWGWNDSTSRVIEQYQPHTYELDEAPAGRVGVGGREHWWFRGKAAGTETLTMTYRRPWETASASDQKYTVTVTVK